MTRNLEQALWEHVAAGLQPRAWVKNALASGQIKHPKQAWSTLEKWASKGLYDYGVALDLGRLVAGAAMPDRRAA